jgi:CRISPR-associated endonuclease Csn1
MRKHILGLDLGVGSIGWALIETEDDQPKRIVGMGSRIVPISKDDNDQFSKGQAISKNADRTTRRTTRKGYDRYQLRRALLTQVLRQNGMLPERMDEHVIDLWKLRSDAATEGHQLTLPQIGRVLYHINQKRGYKHAKADNGDSKQTKYVEAVNKRYTEIQEAKQTIGQHFYLELLRSKVESGNGPYYTFRIKDKVFPRAAYIAEFDQIMRVQRAFYPEVLTDELIDTLRNRIIFYQRPLKSCKHLVSLCEFEMKPYKTKDGKIVYGGPKCAPRTSPLAQLCTMWETANNITLINRNNERYEFSLDERRQIVEYLCTHEALKLTDLYKILGITKKDGWYGGKAIGKGIKGNVTLSQLRKALYGKYCEWLEMPIERVDVVDNETAEVFWQVSPKVEETPLFRLWHAVYSIQDADELAKTLRAKFGIEDQDVIDALCKIDFVKPGYANKSHKFIRRLLPYLMEGMMYSEACARIGINHSNSMTTAERDTRPLAERIELLQKNALRQPVIEKVLNQMINLVNRLQQEYGPIDEARVELARELKQSREERENAFKRNNQNERLNKEIADKIQEMGIRPSRSRIQKYKMWWESQGHCFYCDNTVDIKEFLNGADVEIEHIIPRSILFDDSFSNKVCACRECNREKGNMTALDYLETKPAAELEGYKQRVDEAFKEGRISKTKRDHLLWHKSDIPTDFIDRQLRQSQYIAVKAVEILQQGIRQVWTSGGSVTDFLRHQWGYDEILHALNLPRYQQVEGMTENERIKNWNKRIDHRHHAIDALTVALTRQAYIQRLNTLEASHDFMEKQVKEAGTQYNGKKSVLEKWVNEQPHFSVEDVTQSVDGILVSFRAGKRVTTPARRAIYQGGKRTIVQRDIQVPRGALTNEFVYTKSGEKYARKYPITAISNPDNIVDATIRQLVKARLAAFNGNAKEAFKEPLYSAEGMEIRTVRCYNNKLSDRGVVAIKYNEHREPIGYAETDNNHHLAIYCNSEGELQESIVSFYEAVKRKIAGMPIIDEHPQPGWQLVLTMQENEMIVLGMNDDDFEKSITNSEYQLLNKHLYRVQSLSHGDYYFCLHTESKASDKNECLKLGSILRIRGVNSLQKYNPHKVKIDIMGRITKA